MGQRTASVLVWGAVGVGALVAVPLAVWLSSPRPGAPPAGVAEPAPDAPGGRPADAVDRSARAEPPGAPPTARNRRELPPGDPPPDDYPVGRPRGELPLARNLGDIKRLGERTWLRLSGWVALDAHCEQSLKPGSASAPCFVLRLEDNLTIALCFEQGDRDALVAWLKAHPPGTPVEVEGFYALSLAQSISVWHPKVLPAGFR